MTDTTMEAATTTEAPAPAASAAPTPTPASPADGATGGKGGKGGGAVERAASGEFWEGFGDAKLKESPVVLRHKSVEDLARSLVAAESRLGVPADQLIRMPTKDEDYAEVWKRLGGPETPEGYKITLPEGATDADKKFAADFAKHMHEKGPFPPQMVAAVVDFVNADAEATTKALAEADETRKAEGEALLKKELGAAYDPDMKAVGRMLQDLGGKELADELTANGWGDKPQLMLALHKLMEGRSEPQSLDGAGSGTGGGVPMTPGQAKAARIVLENDPIKGVALRDSGHPMNKAVNEERRRLFALEAGRNPDTQA